MPFYSGPKSNRKGLKQCSREASPQCFHICLLKVWSISLINSIRKTNITLTTQSAIKFFSPFVDGNLHTSNESWICHLNFYSKGVALWVCAHWPQNSNHSVIVFSWVHVRLYVYSTISSSSNAYCLALFTCGT